MNFEKMSLDPDFKVRRPTKDERENIRSIFSKFDNNGDNRISKHEVCRAIRMMGIQVSFEEADEVISTMDQDKDGYISHLEFEKTMMFEICRREFEDRVLRDVFNMCDLNKDGFISKVELVKIFKSVGENQRQAEQLSEELLDEADQNSDGRVSYKEFIRLFKDPKK